METFALFNNARKFGKQATALLTVSDLFFSVAFFTIFANNGFLICFTGTLSLSCICKTSYLLPVKGNLPTNN